MPRNCIAKDFTRNPDNVYHNMMRNTYREQADYHRQQALSHTAHVKDNPLARRKLIAYHQRRADKLAAKSLAHFMQIKD